MNTLHKILKRAASPQVVLNSQDALLVVHSLASLRTVHPLIRNIAEKAAFSVAADAAAVDVASIVDCVNSLTTLQAAGLPVVHNVLARRFDELTLHGAGAASPQTLQKAALALTKLGVKHAPPRVCTRVLRLIHEHLRQSAERDAGLTLAFIALFPYTTMGAQGITVSRDGTLTESSRVFLCCVESFVEKSAASASSRSFRVADLKGNRSLQFLHALPVLCQPPTVQDVKESSSNNPAALEAILVRVRIAREEVLKVLPTLVATVSPGAYVQLLHSFKHRFPAVQRKGFLGERGVVDPSALDSKPSSTPAFARTTNDGGEQDSVLIRAVLSPVRQDSYASRLNIYDVAKMGSFLSWWLAHDGALRGIIRRESRDGRREDDGGTLHLFTRILSLLSERVKRLVAVEGRHPVRSNAAPALASLWNAYYQVLQSVAGSAGVNRGTVVNGLGTASLEKNSIHSLEVTLQRLVALTVDITCQQPISPTSTSSSVVLNRANSIWMLLSICRIVALPWELFGGNGEQLRSSLLQPVEGLLQAYLGDDLRTRSPGDRTTELHSQLPADAVRDMLRLIFIRSTIEGIGQHSPEGNASRLLRMVDAALEKVLPSGDGDVGSPSALSSSVSSLKPSEVQLFFDTLVTASEKERKQNEPASVSLAFAKMVLAIANAAETENSTQAEGSNSSLNSSVPPATLQEMRHLDLDLFVASAYLLLREVPIKDKTIRHELIVLFQDKAHDLMTGTTTPSISDVSRLLKVLTVNSQRHQPSQRAEGLTFTEKTRERLAEVVCAMQRRLVRSHQYGRDMGPVPLTQLWPLVRDAERCRISTVLDPSHATVKDNGGFLLDIPSMLEGHNLLPQDAAKCLQHISRQLTRTGGTKFSSQHILPLRLLALSQGAGMPLPTLLTLLHAIQNSTASKVLFPDDKDLMILVDSVASAFTKLQEHRPSSGDSLIPTHDEIALLKAFLDSQLHDRLGQRVTAHVQLRAAVVALITAARSKQGGGAHDTEIKPVLLRVELLFNL